ncbi:MAG: cell wall-associated protein wapA [Bdellovibrionales bacterium]|nr:cell wall-associated protein wapA [Bdellovibrionales bacterium]
MMKALITAALTAFFATTAGAVVDMKNANYANTWTDLIVPGSGYDLRVQRTYNSRSLFNGIFGFGWCSDFETTLEVTAEGNLRVTECGGGLEVVYTAKNFSSNNVDKTIDTIIDEVKKRNRDLKPQYFTDLKKELVDNAFLRDEFTRQLKLKGNIVSGQTYFANGREAENVVFKDGKYKRSLEDGTFQQFDSSGHLVTMYDRNGNHLKLEWKGPQLVSVVDNNGRKLSLSYHGNKRLKQIAGPNGILVKYVFAGEDLKEVLNAWKNTFKYEYDDVHNLVKIEYPDKSFKQLTYNKDRDWVTSFRNRKGCVETYAYDVDNDNPKDHYWSTVEKTCGKKVTNKSTYEFFHRKRKDGLGKYLYRVRTDNNGSISDIVYHETFGKPISVLRNKFKVTYGYYPNGFVKEKKENLRNLEFRYEQKCQKVSEVRIEYFQPEIPKKKAGDKNSKRSLSSFKKKLVKKTRTSFKYDSPKCNLVYAKNTDGQTAKIQYDTRGRMAVIEDQSKKIVKIQYEERFGKPAKVERPGLGTIHVTYKSDGEIAKVQSKEGPTVAVQVASIFNNLLDIIAPATSETNL